MFFLTILVGNGYRKLEFRILKMLINSWLIIMIGHQLLVVNLKFNWTFRLYKRRLLILMIALTWLGCFGSLLPTLFGQWGVFGLDEEMGSCSILQDRHQHSPKEFLFVVAFLLPCVAIVVCYARIFFIVRQAAAVSHGQRPMKSLGGADPRSSGPDQPRNNAKPIYKSRYQPYFQQTNYKPIIHLAQWHRPNIKKLDNKKKKKFFNVWNFISFIPFLLCFIFIIMYIIYWFWLTYSINYFITRFNNFLFIY